MKAGQLLQMLMSAGLHGAIDDKLHQISPNQLVIPRPSRGLAPRGSARGAMRMARGRYRNLKELEEAAARTTALDGNPPGYTYAHHDALVRKFGAKLARGLERKILARTITYRAALAFDFFGA